MPDDTGRDEDACAPIAETCNAADDDCDGTVDEDFADLGTACTTGVGACAVDGTVVCSADGTAAECDAVAGAPGTETCDNTDEDCDGTIDNGVTMVCYTGPAGTQGVGVCAEGTATCDAGVFGACTGEVTPGAESCNGLDDNCDGASDEMLGSTTCGTGACSRTVENCVGGTPQTCMPGTPGAETCDNTDEDCDGTIDNGVTRACYTGPAGTMGVGVCAGGTETCSAGTFGSCTGEVTPSTETCNGRDDDCNGMVDDGLGSSTCGTGACSRTVMNCVGGTPQTCTPGTPGLETCNNVDDDCDGAIDNGVTRSCYGGPPGTLGVGTCAAGLETCSAGAFGACMGDTRPAPETCDGLDNDCNASTDEMLGSSSCGVGECARTVMNCIGGMPQMCVPGTPAAEVCDGRDQDCNGVTDDGLGMTSCGVGACRRTVNNCVGGMAQMCTPGAPAAEVCDGIDNDCDGMIDDGIAPITCGRGVCQRTVPGCTGGMVPMCTPGAPGTETCNGMDDDCNGTVDDGAAAPVNDTRVAATVVPITGTTRTLSTNTTCATNNTTGSCGCTSGRDVFYRFTLAAPAIVYADTIGATWDTSLFFQDAAGVNVTSPGIPGGLSCNDDGGLGCSTGLQTQIAARLPAGTFYLVLSGCGSGAANIRMQNLPVGNGPIALLNPGAGAVVAGTTAGTGIINQTCGNTGTAPENTYWWASCGPSTGGAFSASTCSRATWDTILSQQSAGRAAVSVCNDDACALQSTVNGTIPAGPGLHALYIDGFSGAASGFSGAYSILYTRP